MRYVVAVEAKGYGQAEVEGDLLSGVLPEDTVDLKVQVGADLERGMLRVSFEFEAESGLDAHEEGMTLWRAAWEEAFAAHGPPLLFSITARLHSAADA